MKIQKTNKVISLMLSVLMLLSFFPNAALAEYSSLAPIDVRVRIEGYGKTHIAYTDVNVTNFDFSDYGLNISGVAENTITPLHALIQLLADKGHDIDSTTISLASSGMIMGIFGEGDSYHSWMYSVNGEMPTGENGSVTQFALQEQDSIVFFCVDWMYGYQSWFDKEEAEITVGDSVELTLSGINLMNWMFYEDDTVEAIEGARLYITDDTNTVHAANVITDEDGKAALTFDIPGTYLISASFPSMSFPMAKRLSSGIFAPSSLVMDI